MGLRRREVSPGAREQESDGAAPTDPHSKQRKALEKKAEAGDVYAIRELREHHEYWYGQADTGPLHALATPLQLQALHAIATDVRAGVESTWLAISTYQTLPSTSETGTPGVRLPKHTATT
jgi:hypothetical protein